MALTTTPLYDENGDVVDPAFFVQGMATHAGQFNAGIDRDNMPPNTIGTGDVNGAQDVFTDITPSINTETSYALERLNTTWQGGQGSGALGLGRYAATFLQDAHIDIHLGIGWTWGGAYSLVHVAPGTKAAITDTVDTVQWRACVDGIPVCVLGPFEDGMLIGNAYGVGSIVVAAGPHVITIEGKVVRIVMQTGAEDGPCTNTCTANHRTLMSAVRIR